MEDLEHGFLCVGKRFGDLFAVVGVGVRVCVIPPWQDRKGQGADVSPNSRRAVAAESREGTGAEGEDALNGDRVEG